MTFLKRRWQLLLFIITLVFPLVVRHEYALHVFWEIFLFAALGIGWNLIGGYAGQLSLGHSAFFAVGAYTSILLMESTGLTPFLGMIVGGFLAMVFAFLIGYPCFRLRGPFFTLSTIAFAEILRILLLHYQDFTGGALGKVVPFVGEDFWNMQFYSKMPYYYLALALLVLVLMLGAFIERSKLGYYLAAISEDQDAAESIGVKAYRVKLIALLISAFIAAVCGTIFAFTIGYIDPYGVANLDLSVEIAVIAMIGGVGRLWGPVLGSALVITLTEATNAALGGLRGGAGMALYGILLIIVVLHRPDGLLSYFERPEKKTKSEHAARGAVSAS